MEMGSNFDALKLLKLICNRQRKREKKTEKESRGNQFQTNIKDIIIRIALKGVVNYSILE